MELFMEQELLNQTVEEPYLCLFYLRKNQESDTSQFPNWATYYDEATKHCVFGWVPLHQVGKLTVEERNEGERRVLVDFRCSLSGIQLWFGHLLVMIKVTAMF